MFGSNSKHAVNALMSTPPIPLERPVPQKLAKTSYVTFKLRTVPTNAESLEYDFSMKYFRSGNAEELLIWIKDMEKVFTGTNTNTGPARYALARRVLQGDALSAFERASATHGNETVENLKKCFESLKKHVFPLNAYQRQRHFMNRLLKKPKESTIRAFMTRVNELNEYLALFPSPSDAVQAKKFENHEIADIASNAIPHSWRKTMAMHNFDPLIHTLTEFTQFCERIQFAEGISPHSEKESHTESSTGSTGGKSRAVKSKKKSSPASKKRSGMWCEYHKTDSHDTGECKVMIAQAKKMRETFENSKGTTSYTRPSNSDSNHNHKKVTWKKNTNSNDNYAAELTNLLGKMIEKATSSPAKAKNEDDSNSDSDDGVEHYNLDTIDAFLDKEGTKNKPVELDDKMEVETTTEAKKNCRMGRTEKLAQEVSHEFENF